MFTSKLFKRIDLQANLNTAQIVSNIPIQTLDKEYQRLRDFFDKNTLLNEVKAYLKSKQDGKQNKENLEIAFTEFLSIVKSFCDVILGQNHNKGIHLAYLENINTEIVKDVPSYQLVCEAYQALIARISILVNTRKVEILNENIVATRNNIITEVEKSRCTLV